MTNTKSKLAAAVLAAAVTMTLSAASADARVAHHEAAVHSTTLRGAHAEHRGSYNYAPTRSGNHFAEPNGPDNYNPNES